MQFSPTITNIALAAVAVVAFIGIVVVLARRGRIPINEPSPYLEALVLLIDGRSDEAFSRLQSAVRSGKVPNDAYIRLGRMYRERGDASRALQIHKTLTVNADLTREEKIELFANIAEDYATLNRPEKAVEVLETAVKNMGLRDARVLRILARECQKAGRAENAYSYLLDLKKMGKVTDRDLALFMTTVSARMVLDGKEREARKSLQKALRHDDDCASAHLAMGDLAEAEEDTEAAIARWKRAAVLAPELAGSALQRIQRALFQQGTFNEVENVYREVLAARPRDEVATLALADFYRKQGRGEAAISLLEEFLTANPRSVGATLLLTSLYASHRNATTLARFLDSNAEAFGRKRDYQCPRCDFTSTEMRWHCPRCNSFEPFQSQAGAS